jgi:predicted dehydrogenase
MPVTDDLDRRGFLGAGAALGLTNIAAADDKKKRIKVGVIGCGSVSHSYLPHLSKSPFVELVSACDRIPDRAKSQAAKFKIPHHYPNIEAMLAGASFDLFVNLTDMQEHERLNGQAIEAGKHVWSEKPMANSLAAGRKLLEAATAKKLKIWGAPCMTLSPQFAFIAETLSTGKLGRLAAAHADYGHTGPDWSPFFYEKGGGSLPDLAVYNLTTVTGLLGPAKQVAAMTSIVTPTRRILRIGDMDVEAEDNAMVLMDHGEGVISHVQSGFNYFNLHGHDGSQENRQTLTIVGSRGWIGLVGYDWAPHAVDVAFEHDPKPKRGATETHGFVWQMGASQAAECLARGHDMFVTPEHALHVLEIIQATRESQETGRRIPLQSTFKWPVVG